MSVLRMVAAALTLTVVAGSASAATISYADSVVDFNLGTSNKAIKNTDPTAALGAADYTSGSGYVSLGFGGSLTVEFTSSTFTGSGTDADDLFVTEIGALSEGTKVQISKNGTDFFDVGISGIANAYGIDIDAFGFGVDDVFSFVRLLDDSTGGSTGIYAGADIDSVAALNSTPNPTLTAALLPAAVPLPAAGWLLIGAFGGLAAFKRRKS